MLQKVDYQKFLTSANPTPDVGIDSVVSFLRTELAYVWWEHYKASTRRLTNVINVTIGSFVYMYDYYSELEASGKVPVDSEVEDRLVAAFGISAAPIEVRDAVRMRGWLGPTERRFGPNLDKGHVFGRSFGGGKDGPGINIWPQARPLNRGWSQQGKTFRNMEQYCAAHPGTFCFTRPRYADQTSHPTAFEFGILLPDKTFWVEEFQNQKTDSR